MQIPTEIIKTVIAIDDKFFDLRGLVEYSSLGLSTLRSLIKNNGLPHYAIRNEKGAISKILVKKSEFDSHMAKNFKMDIDAIADEVLQEFAK